MHRPRSRLDFKIALICALSVEASCVQALFDEFWDDHGKVSGDSNAYTTGVIGKHNVVLAYMPGMGVTSAAGVAAGLRLSFPKIELVIIVGVCGGVPFNQRLEEIVLGDVVISQALIQYDFGRQIPAGFERKKDVQDNLGRAPAQVRAIQAKLETYHHRNEMRQNMLSALGEIQEKMPEIKYPGVENDILYQSSHMHIHRPLRICDQCDEVNAQICPVAFETNCQDLGCGTSMLVNRSRFQDASRSPKFHFGIVASGNSVMKSGLLRDQIARKEGVIAFEMEGAGIWDYFPSIVIKGVCDYADSHKRKGWQPYAAATAAACTKAFLMEWSVSDTAPSPDQLFEVDIMQKEREIMEWLSTPDFCGKQTNFLQRAQTGTGHWIFDESHFKSWLNGKPRLLWCSGQPGTGKTTLMAIIIEQLLKSKKQKEALAWIYIDYREGDVQTLDNLYANILVQLFRQSGRVSKLVMSCLGSNWHETKPTVADYRMWLRDELKHFDRTTILIDALDELDDRDLGRRFVAELQQLNPLVHMLVSSRPQTDMSKFGPLSKIDLHPRREDVVLYVRARVQGSTKLQAHVKLNPAMSDLLVERLIDANDRM